MKYAIPAILLFFQNEILSYISLTIMAVMLLVDLANKAWEEQHQ